MHLIGQRTTQDPHSNTQEFWKKTEEEMASNASHQPQHTHTKGHSRHAPLATAGPSRALVLATVLTMHRSHPSIQQKGKRCLWEPHGSIWNTWPLGAWELEQSCGAGLRCSRNTERGEKREVTGIRPVVPPLHSQTQWMWRTVHRQEGGGHDARASMAHHPGRSLQAQELRGRGGGLPQQRKHPACHGEACLTCPLSGRRT